MHSYTSQILKNLLKDIEPETIWIVEGPIIKSRECNIYKATSPSSHISIAAKHYHSTVSINAFELQLKALLRYHPVLTDQSPVLKVPRVFFANSYHRFLGMEWIDGQTLHHCLWNSPHKKNLLTSYLNRAGQWLRKFHDLSEPETVDFVILELMTSLNKMINKVGSQKIFSSLFFSENYNFLKKIDKTVSEINTTTKAIQHGDFTPLNIMLNEKNMYALDLWANERKPIEHDVCRMIVYLTVAYPLYMFGNVFNKQGKFSHRLMPLIDGYGRDRMDPQSISFKISLYTEFLRRWLVISSRDENFYTHLTNLYQLKRIESQSKKIQNLIQVAHQKR